MLYFGKCDRGVLFCFRWEWDLPEYVIINHIHSFFLKRIQIFFPIQMTKSRQMSHFLCFSQLQTHEVVEVCAKILYQVELNRGNLDIMWGFSVEAELVENTEKQDELCCYVSRVEERSVAMHNGKLSHKTLGNKANLNKIDFFFLCAHYLDINLDW